MKKGIIIIILIVIAVVIFYLYETIQLKAPDLYPKYQWTSVDIKSIVNDRPNIQVFPAFNNEQTFHPDGKFYKTANTDPYLKTWKVENEQCIKKNDGPCGFYGGENDFINYYEDNLKKLGYADSSLNMDTDLHIVKDGKYSLSLGNADGPSGTVRALVKNQGDKIRLVVISSHADENTVFISDIFTPRELMK
jgi:WD40 repeat protein